MDTPGEDRRPFWLGLNRIEGVRRSRLLQLVQHLGSPEAAWKASPERLAEVPGWGERAVRVFLRQRAEIVPDKEAELVGRSGVRFWTWEDPEYPPQLREIGDPPLVLYVCGQDLPPQTPLVAVVGTRRATAYGRQVARKLARELAEAGIGVVSGLALGVDSMAHLGALEAGGFTVGVLGCGPDVVYPPENARLYEAVASRGVLVTEYPLGTQPRPWHFPARNRIISGLTLGVVVVEAGSRSGALITADLALEQGREVFAVPGPVTSPYSQGCNELIKQGAKLVQTVADILEEYGLETGPAVASKNSGLRGLGGPEKRVLRLLRGGPVQFEELAEVSGYNTTELAQILTFLEVRGLVQALPGKQYVARNPD
ncbi:MAG: DNA-processing protein DprA [Moorellales bacterium]